MPGKLLAADPEHLGPQGPVRAGPDFYQLVRTVGPVDEREGVVHVGQRRVFGREDVLACADLDAPVVATVRT